MQGLVDQIEKNAEDATRIALEEKEMRLRKMAEEKEMKLRKLAEEKTEHNLRLLKESLTCMDLIRNTQNPDGVRYNWNLREQLSDLLNKIKLI